MRLKSSIASFVLAAISLSGCAQAQPSAPPAAVAARIAELDRACTMAGGRPGTQPYVFVHDYDGDGRSDFLIAERAYDCAGKPALFVTNNLAGLDIYLAEANGGARRAFREAVLGYRLAPGAPTRVAIVRMGAACGPGSTAASQCAVALRWDAASRVFAMEALGAPPAGTAAEAPPAPESRAAFVTRCRADTLRAHPDWASGVAEMCTERWNRATAAMPFVEALLAVAARPPASLRTAADLRAALPAVRWNPPSAPIAPATLYIDGSIGAIAVAAQGRGRIDTFGLHWSEKGETPPYDVAEALRVRGVALRPIACASGGGAFGNGENHVYRVDLPGAAPFALTTFSAIAEIGMQDSFYTADIDIGKPLPTLASVRAADPDSPWTADCPG